MDMPDIASARVHGLVNVSQALNTSRRAALVFLRQGGNTAGAHAGVLGQTGFPHSVDFSSGAPRYLPHDTATALHADVCLFIGSAAASHLEDLVPNQNTHLVAIGPAVSASVLRQAAVIIDCGTAGIHSAGTVMRMDDVPLPVRPLLSGALDARAVCGQLLAALRQVPTR
jgi:formylmethanofuran dehydrogenase subunit B